MSILRLCFTRWMLDIASGKRTVAHVRPLSGTYAAGDEVQLFGTVPPDEETGGGWKFGVISFVRCAAVVDVRKLKLLDHADTDLSKLNADTREEYLARWNVTNPDLPADGDPEVSRVEWRYTDSVLSEWCLAT
jgi:hypothetical protein